MVLSVYLFEQARETASVCRLGLVIGILAMFATCVVIASKISADRSLTRT